MTIFFWSCSKLSLTNKLFIKASPYDNYVAALKKSGLEEAALAARWLTAGAEVLENNITIQPPYKESGYFLESKPLAAGFNLSLKRGEVVSASIAITSLQQTACFIDLFIKDTATGKIEKVASALQDSLTLMYECDEDGLFCIRFQPELLSQGNYELTITKRPAYAFPVSGKDSRAVGSFMGAGRGGGRKHEGIDIFANKGTPVVAVASGIVSQSGNNRLGGKVIFVADARRKQSIYYAHLDSQFVSTGKMVSVSDTLGLVGNTGNAATTAPHLHFGIYRWGRGAIDPYPFVHMPPQTTESSKLPLDSAEPMRRITTNTEVLNAPGSNGEKVLVLPANSVVSIVAATKSWYRIYTPDSKAGYIAGRNVSKFEKLNTVRLDRRLQLYVDADTNSVKLATLEMGTEAANLGKYGSYTLVQTENISGWVRFGR